MKIGVNVGAVLPACREGLDYSIEDVLFVKEFVIRPQLNAFDACGFSSRSPRVCSAYVVVVVRVELARFFGLRFPSLGDFVRPGSVREFSDVEFNVGAVVQMSNAVVCELPPCFPSKGVGVADGNV